MQDFSRYEQQKILQIWPLASTYYHHCDSYQSLDSMQESDTPTTLEEDAVLGTGCSLFPPRLCPIKSFGPDHVKKLLV